MASHGFLEDSLFTFDISHQKRPLVKQYISKQPHTRRVQILNVARYAYNSCRFPTHFSQESGQSSYYLNQLISELMGTSKGINS
jgi:hypothetical protein